MTEKRLFVGRKKCEDRFTIITDYDDEIGVKENRSGDVLVLKHSDLNAQQFVAQLVVFLNDQNQAIVDLYDGSKYWSDKATEKIKELEKENEKLKEENQELTQKKNDLKELLMNSEPVLEQKELQKIIFKMVYAAIDDKIKEAEEGFQQTYDAWYQGQIDGLKELKKEFPYD